MHVPSPAKVILERTSRGQYSITAAHSISIEAMTTATLASSGPLVIRSSNGGTTTFAHVMTRTRGQTNAARAPGRSRLCARDCPQPAAIRRRPCRPNRRRHAASIQRGRLTHSQHGRGQRAAIGRAASTQRQIGASRAHPSRRPQIVELFNQTRARRACGRIASAPRLPPALAAP